MSKIKTTHFIYDGAKLIGEYNSDGSVKNEYIYLDNIPVGVIPRGYPQDGVKYIHTDHLGTPRRLADENGNIVWSWESEPFGESKAVGSVEFNLRFAGQYFDSETKTHYNINRDYNPQTGRYIESDPIGFDGGVNSYGYVTGNPLGAVDEMGLVKLNWFLDNKDNKTMTLVIPKYAETQFYEVYGHGNQEVINKLGTRLNAKQLNQALIDSKKCPKGSIVKLNSCNTGAGSNSIAKQLSGLGNYPNVYAPSGTLTFSLTRFREGKDTYGATLIWNGESPNGSWKYFYKGQNK
jgi:RHS repeat-associated protein